VNTQMPALAVSGAALAHPSMRLRSNSTQIADSSWQRVALPFAAMRLHAANDAVTAANSAKSAQSGRYAYTAKPAAPPRGEPR
jgi:hypothetical protein